MWRKVQSVLSTLLIIVGLLMPGVGTAIAPNQQQLVAANPSGSWDFVSPDPADIPPGNSTTITYTLVKAGNPQDISHLTLIVPTCLVDHFDANPFSGYTDKDGSLVKAGLYDGPVVKGPGGSATYTWTVTYAAPTSWGTTLWTAYIKSGIKSGDEGTPGWTRTSALGPACPPAPAPTKGSIKVRVWDNTDTSNPVAISNFIVSLTGTTLTGSTTDGLYTFNDLTLGSYTASATANNPNTGTDPKTGQVAVTITEADPHREVDIYLSWPQTSPEP
ncbi:MAG: hypothetical protein ACOY94_05890, partial [Bacillota bacterium]